MMRWNLSVAAILCAVALASCNPAAFQAGQVAPATPTAQPAGDAPPATRSPAAALATEEAGQATMATPIPAWQDLPVMPGAREGRPAGLGYIFSIDAPPDQVERYYQEQLAAGNWQFVGRQAAEEGALGGPTAVLGFRRGEEQAAVMLAVSKDEGYTVVLLLQYAGE